MMNKVLILVVLAIFTVALVGCITQTHVVGNGGPANGKKIEQKQWFFVWGFVDKSKTDSLKMAGGATDYTIKTQFNWLDSIIGIFSVGIVTPRTVTVTK